MPPSSSTALTLDNASDVEAVMPRATELMLKMKQPHHHVSWPSVIQGTVYTAMALYVMFGMADIEGRFGWFVFLCFLATLPFIGDEWSRQQKRQALMVDLLGELVAQNNEFRRQLQRLGQERIADTPVRS